MTIARTEVEPEASAVSCSGCGEPVEPAEQWGEWLATPLGWTVHRTHRRRGCVVAGRERLEGRHVDPAPTEREKLGVKVEAPS